MTDRTDISAVGGLTVTTKQTKRLATTTRHTVVRIDPETNAALDEISDALCLSKTATIRMALVGMYREIRTRNNTLPGQRVPVVPDWENDQQ
jgi:predicted transcriptional regulator